MFKIISFVISLKVSVFVLIDLDFSNIGGLLNIIIVKLYYDDSIVNYNFERKHKSYKP